ncbi:hypothetical protein BDA99DRAFT_569180 [Phascolomyces articulosus]|uniref:PB1 domain-containing protein n=1 Tax=Phascolomyces articulosus TaxID=60185 RepID=A0AAD5PHK2_9FUNG|nr:hypothetical protein BDA99DRAFT_569180 [Phascolomyces articulosus]
MGYPNWEDVNIKAKNEATDDIYRFFAARSECILDLLGMLEDRFSLRKGHYTAYYQDDQNDPVLLETEHDLHCAFNRRKPRSGKDGVKYGDNPIYFLRIFIKHKKNTIIDNNFKSSTFVPENY